MTTAMTANEMVAAVEGNVGREVFVSYLAGNPPTERAIREARRAKMEGMARRHFTGKIHAVKTNKKGEPYLVIATPNRDNESTGEQWNYRSFNPQLGTLLTIEVL